MNKSYSIHHICSFIVKNQLSGHSYSVPALCESLSKNINIHFHTTGKSNLIFNPSFEVHEYKIDPFLNSILSSPLSIIPKIIRTILLGVVEQKTFSYFMKFLFKSNSIRDLN